MSEWDMSRGDARMPCTYSSLWYGLVISDGRIFAVSGIELIELVPYGCC